MVGTMNEDTVERRQQNVGQAMEQDHERCEACHRRLKDPESMRIGMGPVCRKRHAAEFQATREA